MKNCFITFLNKLAFALRQDVTNGNFVRPSVRPGTVYRFFLFLSQDSSFTGK